MAEDLMVQMLMRAAGGNVLSEQDIRLARAAAHWAHTIGEWRAHTEGGFVFTRGPLFFWVLTGEGPDPQLEIRVSPDGVHWHPHMRARIDHVGHGLNVLASEAVLPARFCTLGRQALAELARAELAAVT